MNDNLGARSENSSNIDKFLKANGRTDSPSIEIIQGLKVRNEVTSKYTVLIRWLSQSPKLHGKVIKIVVDPLRQIMASKNQQYTGVAYNSEIDLNLGQHRFIWR